MRVLFRSAAAMIAAVGAFSVLPLATPVMAAAPKASASPSDVSALVGLIREAIRTAESGFKAGESETDKEAAIQSAINGVLSAGTYDAITAQAALQTFAGSSTRATPTQQAANALLVTVGPAAQQEANQAVSTAPTSTGSTSGSFSAGSGTAASGGGGYLVGH
jgi:hypothetical protein